MPEMVIIPTKDELKLSTDENQERLLGYKLDDLDTARQRLDYIEQVETEARATNDLINKARDLLSHPQVDQENKNKLSALIKDDAQSFIALQQLVETLTSTVSLNKGKDSVPATITVDLTPQSTASGSVESPVETPVEVENDLSQITRVEDLIGPLKAALHKMSDDQLIAILQEATGNWVQFNTEKYGLRLPHTLTKHDLNAERKLADLYEAVSPIHLMVSNAAVELWLRKVTEIWPEGGGVFGMNRALNPDEIEVYSRLQDAMGKLFSQSARLELLDAVRAKMPARGVFVIESNLQVVKEFLSLSTQQRDIPPLYLSVNPDRRKDILQAMQLAFAEKATGINGLIARNNNYDIGMDNLSRYNDRLVIWQNRMQGFINNIRDKYTDGESKN